MSIDGVHGCIICDNRPTIHLPKRSGIFSLRSTGIDSFSMLVTSFSAMMMTNQSENSFHVTHLCLWRDQVRSSSLPSHRHQLPLNFIIRFHAECQKCQRKMRRNSFWSWKGFDARVHQYNMYLVRCTCRCSAATTRWRRCGLGYWQQRSEMKSWMVPEGESSEN